MGLPKLRSAALILPFFILLAIPFDFPEFPLPESFPEEEVLSEAEFSSAATFSDPDYNNLTTSFSPGEMVYVLFESNVSGETERLARILDAGKSELFRRQLSRSGSAPYRFTTSFTAPSASGTHYLDISLKTGTSQVAAFQQNITVGEGDGEVTAEAIAEAITGGQVQEDGLPEATEPAEEAPEPPTEPEAPSYIQQLLEQVQAFLALIRESLARLF